MESTANTHLTTEPPHPGLCLIGEPRSPFAQDWVTITKQEHIELRQRASYWEAQHGRAKAKLAELEQALVVKEAKIKDLQNRLFGKKSEKHAGLKSEKDPLAEPRSGRPRGQQPGHRGHGRTQRPHLPVVTEDRDLPEEEQRCPECGLAYQRNPALDEQSEVIEVEVKAHIRRYRRPSYTCHPCCRCEATPVIITAPAPPKLIPRSPYGVSFWVEVILGKYRYGQPTHRYLQDLKDQGLLVSAGTVAGGLQALVPLFEPVREALYDKQMSEPLFHNDETRWEVFVELEDKVGTRWYLWLTRSASVIFYCLDPSRSAAVPGAHFAGLKQDRVIIVCDRYSAYKKLARLVEGILLAFCWAHVRRDFLEAGRAFAELQGWALVWKERIGTLYHLNRLRLEHWEPERALSEQSEAFAHHHQALKTTLQQLHDEATTVVAPDTASAATDSPAASEVAPSAPVAPLSKGAQTQQKKVLQSLLEHWPGLTLFLDHPEVPLDNNRAENTLRTPVTGRKNYYGSGSLWSAQLTATAFSVLQTLGLWGINPRHWLTVYLQACADNGGQAPRDLDPFLPWRMDEPRRAELSRPYPCRAPPGSPTAPVPDHEHA